MTAIVATNITSVPADGTDVSPPRGLDRALFTAHEVAAALAVSTTLVRQLTLSGDLPCRRIGRLVRYTTADIESFVHSFDEHGYQGSGQPLRLGDQSNFRSAQPGGRRVTTQGG